MSYKSDPSGKISRLFAAHANPAADYLADITAEENDKDTLPRATMPSIDDRHFIKPPPLPPKKPAPKR